MSMWVYAMGVDGFFINYNASYSQGCNLSIYNNTNIITAAATLVRPLVPNTWNNAVLTINSGGVQTLYVNADSGTTTYSLTPESSNGRFSLGGPFVQGTNWNFSKCGLCEVILENQVWTPDDVNNYYNQFK